ncbi:MBL fold metallo-hydrolase [Oscillospiraceae bacterium CM]|nr:MBL fold metallo-hydrolase [Oscillospiraceae bacterium CM]
MIFEQLNPHYCRTYLISSDEDSRVVLVDPVLDHFTDYLALLKARRLTLTHVIDTHTHADHISACPALKDALDCAYIMHVNAPAMCVTDRAKDGDTLMLNGIRFDVVATPGHTGDSISLIVGGKLLTGDCLFLDDSGGGRDDLPGGSAAAHWESLSKLSELPDDLLVCPAHEYHDRRLSTLGHQKESNPHLKARTKEAFVQYIEDLRLGPADWMADVLKANYACARDPKGVWIPADIAACELKGTMDKSVNELAVTMMTPQELREALASGAKPLLLDVRQPEELVSTLGAIAGVVNIPIGELSARLGELEAYNDKEIVVICRSGARATTGAQILTKAGFKNVKVLRGGMLAWNLMS